MHRAINSRARVIRVCALLGGLAFVAGLRVPTSADAAPPYEPGNPSNTSASLPSTTAAPPPCSSGNAWLRQPRVVVHTGEYGGATPVDTVVAAITDVDNQIAAVGATTAAVTKTSTSTAAFSYGTSYGNTSPTIHVGFVNYIKPRRGRPARSWRRRRCS